MSKKIQRNRFTFSYPLNDTVIKSWLDNQNGNTSLALRIVLHNWINQHGNKNVVDDILNHQSQTDENVNPNFQTKAGTGETAILQEKQPEQKPDTNKQLADDNEVSAADLNHYIIGK